MGDDVRYLATATIKVLALLALRLTASTGANVFALDIVAGIALGVVVVDVLLDRVPWRFAHGKLLCLVSDKASPVTEFRKFSI